MNNVLKTLALPIISLSLLASQPAVAKEKRRLSSNFQVSEYNRIAQKYFPQPTFIERHISKKKPEQLWIWTDFIREGDSAKYYNGYDFISLSIKHVDDYIAAIDKYLEWREIAIRDSDEIEKTIADTIGRKKSLKVRFSFFSGNKFNHFMFMQNCALDTCLEPSFYFDSTNATALKSTLQKWKDGNLGGKSAEEIDNKYK